MIHAVFFDVDDTLYNYRLSHQHGMEALCRYADHLLGLERPDFLRRYQAQMDRQVAHLGLNSAATHNRLIRLQWLLEELRLPLTHAPVMTRLYWETMLAHMEPYPGVREVFVRLRDMGVKVGIGTNMTADWQYEKLSRLGLLGLVDCLVTSEEAGFEKPDPQFFRYCAKKVGCAPAECLFVGDSLRHDVTGALSAGMAPVWFCPEGAKPAPDGVRVITALGQLPALAAERKRSGGEILQG